MEREIVNAGTKIALSSLFENLQDDIQLNTFRDFDQIFNTYGVNCDTVSGIVPDTDTTLKVTAYNDYKILINPGTGLTENFNYIDVTSSNQVVVSGLDTGSHTVYIKYAVDLYEQVNVVNGFLYGDGEPTVASREHASYEIVFDTDPGTAGFTLANITVVSGILNSTIIDRRNENVLKLKHKVFPDTIVKTDRDSDINGKLTANYIGIKDSSGYEMLINDIGLTQNEECYASGIVEAHDWRHWHGNEVIQGNRTVLDSLNAITAHTELEGAFRKGIINFQDGNGDRWLVTKIIPSKPNYPTDLTVTLREIIPDELITKALKDSIRSYTVKEIAIAHNINANSAVTAWRAKIANYQTQNPSWDIDNLYAVSGLETEASGLWAQSYAYDAGGIITPIGANYEDGLTALGMRETGGESISSALNTIDSTINNNIDAKDTLDADLTIIGNDVLQKEAEIKTHPDKGKRSFEALCYWTEPTLVDNEAIIKYQLRIYRLSTMSSTVPNNTALDTLLSNYTAEISQEKQADSSVAAIRIDVKRDTVVDDAEGTSTTSRIYVDNMSDIAVGQAVLIIQDPAGTPVRAKSVVTAVGSNYIDLFSSIGFVPTDATNDTVQTYEEIYESIEEYYIEGTAKTTYAFPIDIDQSYIVYIRSISEYLVASDWASGYKFNTNDLDSDGTSLEDITKEDKTFLAKAKEIERKEIKKEFETEILALQQQIAALPTQDQLDNVNDSLSSFDTRITDLEGAAS